MRKKISKLKKNPLILQIIGMTIIGFHAFTIMGALAITVFNSLKSIINITMDPLGFPTKLRFDNYVNAFRQLYVTVSTSSGRRPIYFVELLFNSLVYVIGATLIGEYTHFTCAYVAAKYPNAVTKAMHWIVIFLISFPTVGSLASLSITLQETGIYNNRLLYLLYCGGFTGTDFLIYYSTAKGIDNGYIDAARLDGAGYYRILFQISMPLIKPFLLGMILRNLVGLWNDWFTPMMWLPSYPTISYALYKFQFNTDNSVSQVPAQMAGAILVALPTIALFIAFKNKFIGNVSFGGLKG